MLAGRLSNFDGLPGVFLISICINFLRTSVGLCLNIARLPVFLESTWTVYGNYSYKNYLF